MARSKRQYGSGCLLKRGKGWVIRWREMEIAPDGTTRRALRYETLEPMSRREAGDVLAQRLVAAGSNKAPVRSRVAFRTFASEWQAHVLPMYKHSTQKNHRHILEKHLLPRFGDKPIVEVTRQEIQAYVAQLNQAGYAPKTIDHMHDVLSALLRTGSPAGQSCSPRGSAGASNRSAEMGAHESAGGAAARGVAAAGADDGRARDVVWSSARRAVRVALGGYRLRESMPDRASGGV